MKRKVLFEDDLIVYLGKIPKNPQLSCQFIWKHFKIAAYKINLEVNCFPINQQQAFSK